MTTDRSPAMAHAKSFRLPADTWAALVKLARRRTVERDGQHVSASTLVREALDQYLARHRRGNP